MTGPRLPSKFPGHSGVWTWVFHVHNANLYTLLVLHVLKVIPVKCHHTSAWQCVNAGLLPLLQNSSLATFQAFFFKSENCKNYQTWHGSIVSRNASVTVAIKKQGSGNSENAIWCLMHTFWSWEGGIHLGLPLRLSVCMKVQSGLHSRLNLKQMTGFTRLGQQINQMFVTWDITKWNPFYFFF